MIQLNDIKKSITTKIGKEFNYKIYEEEVTKGLIKPSFFVNIMPVNSQDFLNYEEFLVNVDIMFFPETKELNEKYLVFERLKKLFKLRLDVEDRCLTINELKFQEIDDIFHLFFTLEIFEETDKELYSENDLGYSEGSVKKMEELILEEDV